VAHSVFLLSSHYGFCLLLSALGLVDVSVIDLGALLLDRQKLSLMKGCTEYMPLTLPPTCPYGQPEEAGVELPGLLSPLILSSSSV